MRSDASSLSAMEQDRRNAVPLSMDASHGPVCLVPDSERPGVVTLVLPPSMILEVLELQRLGDKCIVKLSYAVTH